MATLAARTPAQRMDMSLEVLKKGIFIWGLGFFFFFLSLFMSVLVGLVAVLVGVVLTLVDNSLGEE